MLRHWKGQDRKRQDRTGQDRTGQDRTGQDRTGQDRTGQDRTEQDRTEQDRTGYFLTVNLNLFQNKLVNLVSFQVSAIGRPDIAVTWIFDLQLNVARLFGVLCSNAIDCRRGQSHFKISPLILFRI